MIGLDHEKWPAGQKCASWDANYFVVSGNFFRDVQQLKEAAAPALNRGLRFFSFRIWEPGLPMHEVMTGFSRFLLRELGEEARSLRTEFSYNEEIEQSVKQITKPPILESSPLAKELYNICEGNFTEKQIQALEVILKEIVFPGYSKGIEGTEQTFLPGQYGYVECISYLKMFYKYTLEKNPKNKYKYLKKVLENQKDELNKTS